MDFLFQIFLHSHKRRSKCPILRLGFSDYSTPDTPRRPVRQLELGQVAAEGVQAGERLHESSHALRQDQQGPNTGKPFLLKLIFKL